eukprot:31348-Pelagococcus_subviridis.AAC.10
MGSAGRPASSGGINAGFASLHAFKTGLTPIMYESTTSSYKRSNSSGFPYITVWISSVVASNAIPSSTWNESPSSSGPPSTCHRVLDATSASESAFPEIIITTNGAGNGHSALRSA